MSRASREGRRREVRRRREVGVALTILAFGIAWSVLIVLIHLVD